MRASCYWFFSAGSLLFMSCSTDPDTLIVEPYRPGGGGSLAVLSRSVPRAERAERGVAADRAGQGGLRHCGVSEAGPAAELGVRRRAAPAVVQWRHGFPRSLTASGRLGTRRIRRWDTW
jgi:hypothetical protein